MNLNKPMPFIARATMTTDLEYTGHVTLQRLIDSNYLRQSEIGDEKAILAALHQYSKDLDGGEFVESEGSSGSWSIEGVDFVDQ
jgi:hypothetical protein